MCRLHGFMAAMVSNQQGRCDQLQKWPQLFNFPIYYFPSPGIWAGFISYFGQFSSVQLLSHVQLFVTPWTAAHQASLSITNSWSLLKIMSIGSVMSSTHLILCHPLLLPSIFPSTRVFSSESVLCIRGSKYWSFNFNISSSSEYSEPISFRMG